jgi:hypothetical protein
MKVEENINLNGMSFLDGVDFPTISIFGSRHSFDFDSINIKIACEKHTIDYWLEHYEEMGKKYGYTDGQIQEYFQYIKYADKQKQEYLRYIKLVQGLQSK